MFVYGTPLLVYVWVRKTLTHYECVFGRFKSVLRFDFGFCFRFGKIFGENGQN